MLRITQVSLDIITKIQPLIRQARRVGERNLAEQLDSSSTSVYANTCEGNAAAFGSASRKHNYSIALCEARETHGWLNVAASKGLTVPDVSRELDHVIGVLVKVTR